MVKKYMLFLLFGIVLLTVSTFVSAGVVDWVKAKITGKATQQTVTMNITVGVPTVYGVYNASINPTTLGTREAPSLSSFVVNFSVYSPTGVGNLNTTSASVNFSKSGETMRQNLSCFEIQSAGNYANYSCNVTMWWWDASGVWQVTALIKDSTGNLAYNDSTTFTLGTTTGFVMSPTALTWSGLSAGAVNQSSSNDPVLMNNTGNVAITATNIQVNATNLKGETDSAKGLWAGNFSIGFINGGECTGTNMTWGNYVGVATANLTVGNFTINNNITGQEQLYFCIRTVGSELITQQYSTGSEGPWTIKIA